MISTEVLLEKKNSYSKLLDELEDKMVNVNEEVEKRLEVYRNQIREEVLAEIKDDIFTCKNYLEMIDQLLLVDKPENATEEIPETEENSFEEINSEIGGTPDEC